MGIENCRVLGTESGRVGPLAHGGIGATGVGQRARSAVVMTEPLWLQSIGILPVAIKPHWVGVSAEPPMQRLDHPPDRPAAKPLYTDGEPTQSFRHHGSHLCSLPPVPTEVDAPSVDRSAWRTSLQEVEPTS